MKSAMVKFEPKPVVKPKKRNLKLEFEPEEYETLKERAAKAGVSLKEFVRQALRFAINHM